MKVGIVCAGDREVAPFFPVIENCKISEKAMLKIYEGKINGVEVVTLFSGVCKVNAAIATHISTEEAYQIVRYKDFISQREQWLRTTVINEYREATNHPEYQFFLKEKFVEEYRTY